MRRPGRRPLRFASSVPTFTPASLSGLAFWWDSSLGVTLSGATVSRMADQSMNGLDLTQGTPAQQPTYNASDTAFGGKPSVQMVSANTTILTTVNPVNLGLYTVFLVATGLASPATYFWSRGGQADFLFGTNTTIFSAVRSGGTGSSYWGAPSGAWGNFGPTAKIIRVEMDGTHAGHKGYVDNVNTMTVDIIAGNPGTSVTNATFIIGADASSQNAGSFKWSACLGYSRVLSASESSRVDAYLRKRFGL